MNVASPTAQTEQVQLSPPMSTTSSLLYAREVVPVITTRLKHQIGIHFAFPSLHQLVAALGVKKQALERNTAFSKI